jgi:hypothetical protein
MSMVLLCCVVFASAKVDLIENFKPIISAECVKRLIASSERCLPISW